MNVELVAQMFKNYQSNVLFHLEGMFFLYAWINITDNSKLRAVSKIPRDEWRRKASIGVLGKGNWELIPMIFIHDTALCFRIEWPYLSLPFQFNLSILRWKFSARLFVTWCGNLSLTVKHRSYRRNIHIPSFENLYMCLLLRYNLFVSFVIPSQVHFWILHIPLSSWTSSESNNYCEGILISAGIVRQIINSLSKKFSELWAEMWELEYKIMS